jgi:hypothetical protein
MESPIESALPLANRQGPRTFPAVAWAVRRGTPLVGSAAVRRCGVFMPGNTPSANFCLMISWPFDHPSRRGNMRQISWGKFSRLPCTTAESTPCLMETDFAARCPLVRRSRLVFGSCPSARTRLLHASFRPRLAAIALAHR